LNKIAENYQEGYKQEGLHEVGNQQKKNGQMFKLNDPKKKI
jgi:hypothetical protein